MELTHPKTIDQGAHSASVDLPSSDAGKTGWPWTTPSSQPVAEKTSLRVWPRISIVTPSYNHGVFIEETIRSVLSQGYPNLEYIVIDGGSQDGTVEIIRRYEPWLAYWVSEPDRGQAHAINKGLSRASGEFFGYLNSDDLLAANALYVAAETFSSRPTDVIYGKCQYVDRDGNELFTRQGRVSSFLDYLRIWDRIRNQENLTQPEVLCRTAVLKEAGGFREDLHSVMDFEMWLRLLSKGYQFKSVDAVFAKFRSYSEQKSSGTGGSSEIYRVVREFLADANIVIPQFERKQIGRDLERAKAEWLLRDALDASLFGEHQKSLGFCYAAFAAYPMIVGTYLFWTALAGPIKSALPDQFRETLRRVAI